MISFLRTGPNLILKVVKHGKEETIGYATGFNYTVINGQKSIFVVDSPFPAEISHAAGPSMVRGSLTLLMPKGMTLEKAGIVPYRTSGGASPKDTSPNPGSTENFVHLAHSDYIGFRLYDRQSNDLFAAIDYVKVSQYSVSIQAKSIVRAELQFEAKFLISGPG